MTLHLILKKKWYNMIESGEKKEEYREIKPFWQKRLQMPNLFDLVHYDTVTFHYGYSNRTMTFKIKDIVIAEGKSEWGAEPGKKYFVIKI